MIHPVVEKPIIEPAKCNDGSINYSCSNMVNPLVSFDMVKEQYDMQAKSLRTVIDEIYNSIGSINSSIEKFNSDVNRTNDAFALLQRTVNGQLNNMDHFIKNAQQQTTLQITSFSDRLDYFEKQIDSIRNLIAENKVSTDEFLSIVQKKMNDISAQMTEIDNELNVIKEAIANVKRTVDDNSESIIAIKEFTIPKMEDALNEFNITLTEKITAETDRAVEVEKGITKRLDMIENGSSSSGENLKSMIIEETLRAKQQELAIIKLIESNHTSNSEIHSAIASDLKSLNQLLDKNKESIVAESTRATNAENTLNELISNETARATNVEGSLKSDINKVASAIDSVRNEFRSNINELKTDIKDIESNISSITDNVNGIIGETKIEIMEKVNDLIKSEEDKRINSDNLLDENIQKNATAIESKEKESIDRDKELERQLAANNVELDKLINKVDSIMNNMNTFDEKFELLEKQMSDITETIKYLKQRSDSFDDIIKEKINQAANTIISRIESLDNRVDSEVNNVREKMRKIEQRVGNLEHGCDEYKGCGDVVPDNPFISNDNSSCTEDETNPFFY